MARACACAGTTQTKLSLKITVGDVQAGDPILTSAPVEPPLTKENVVTRLVYLPPTMWPKHGTGHGWVAKVQSLNKSKCVLVLHDGPWDFTLAAVLALKPVSGVS